MKPGLTPTQLANPITWRTTVSSHRGDRTLATSLPTLDMSLAVDGTSQIPERLTARFAPDALPEHALSPLAAYGQRLHVSVTLTHQAQDVTYEIGRFLIQSWAEQSDGTVSVEARGLLQTVADAPWPYPTSPVPGSRLVDEARRLAHPLPVELAYGASNPVLERGIAWGEDRLDALHDLGAAHSVRWSVRGDGILWAVPASITARVQRTYTGRDLALHALRKGNHERANQVTFVHTAHEGDDTETESVYATATNHSFPYEPDGYGIVRRVEETEASTNRATLLQMAEDALREESHAVSVRQVEIVADPAIDLWDTIAVHLDNQIIVGRVRAYDLPLTRGDTMRVDIEEYT